MTANGLNRILSSLVRAAITAGSCCFSGAIAADEFVTCYPSYGYLEADHWVVPMRLWVHERRGGAESLSVVIAESIGEYSSVELKNFRQRIAPFLADSESREEVRFIFDNDPEDEEFRVSGSAGGFPKSDLNGLIEGTIALSWKKAEELLHLQKSANGWLTYQVTSDEHTGAGKIQLLQPTGISVISDIDDTIKVTEIPAGSRVVVRNTFFADFVAAPGMADQYHGWQNASFHYVSGSPWQLYDPLSEFLLSEPPSFPSGTFHMKNVRKNLLSARSWRDLTELVTNENVTFDQKVSQITTIMKHFPDRQFILVGDSGEKDPEVYREIQASFPKQVREIRIRDVVNDRKLNPLRLEGMQIIPAPAIAKRKP